MTKNMSRQVFIRISLKNIVKASLPRDFKNHVDPGQLLLNLKIIILLK